MLSWAASSNSLTSDSTVSNSVLSSSGVVYNVITQFKLKIAKHLTFTYGGISQSGAGSEQNHKLEHVELCFATEVRMILPDLTGVFIQKFYKWRENN